MKESFHFSFPIDEFVRRSNRSNNFEKDSCIPYIEREFKKGECIRIERITKLDHFESNGRMYFSFFVEYFKRIPQLDKLIERARPYYENAMQNQWPDSLNISTRLNKKTNWQKEGF